jgi:hypothetical protein
MLCDDAVERCHELIEPIVTHGRHRMVPVQSSCQDSERGERAARRNHPGFLWLPTGLSSDRVAGGAIRSDHVKMLADASIMPLHEAAAFT